jgi:hypothetical protein
LHAQMEKGKLVTLWGALQRAPQQHARRAPFALSARTQCRSGPGRMRSISPTALQYSR